MLQEVEEFWVICGQLYKLMHFERINVNLSSAIMSQSYKRI